MSSTPEFTTVACPFCGEKSGVPDGAAGKTVRCPNCKSIWKLTPEMLSSQPAASPILVPVGGNTSSPLPAKTTSAETPVDEAAASTKSNRGMGPGGMSPLWWFLLGGMAVLVVLIVAVIGGVFAVLLLKGAPSPPPAASGLPPNVPTNASVPENVPPQDQLKLRGDATAAYLEKLIQESHKVLGNPTKLLGMAGAPPGDLEQRLTEWEDAVSHLDTTNVDPVAVQFKERYCEHFKTLVTAISQASGQLHEVPAGDANSLLDSSSAPLAALIGVQSATKEFFDFLNGEGQAVKKDLESRYGRSFSVLSVPQ